MRSKHGWVRGELTNVVVEDVLLCSEHDGGSNRMKQVGKETWDPDQVNVKRCLGVNLYGVLVERQPTSSRWRGEPVTHEKLRGVAQHVAPFS